MRPASFALCLALVIVRLGAQDAPDLLSKTQSKTPNKELLDRIPPRMKQFTEDHTVAGVVTLIARHGEIVQFNAEGMADIEANRPMRKDTIFQIMSMTKPVTGLGIMMLAEEGKLTLRDPVERFLPEFRDQRVATTTGPDAAQLGALVRPVTIADLMTHTSGMFDAPPSEIKGYSQQMNIPLADLVRVFARQPLLFQPSTRWSYSSPGIDVLGRIIEVCSGQKYEDLIEQRILKPLGMKDSFFYPKPEQIPRIAMVYEGHDGQLKRSPGTILGGDPSAYRRGAVYPAPSWGLYSTAEDLLHFYQMMLNGGTYNGHRYLSRFSVNLMTEVHTGDINPSGWLGGGAYGLTWEVVKDPFGELTGHTKGTYGHGGAFGTQGWIDPTNGLIRIMLIQRSNGATDHMRNTFMTMAEASASLQ
jgi:CubicO group peptidase (beta-lactamase class C family)